MGSRLNLQRNLRSGAVIAALGAALAFGTRAPAQTTQGQFTPDASAPIQLHMPVRLHMPAQHRTPAKKKVVRQKMPATTSSSAEAAAIPFGPAAPATSTPKRHAVKATASRGAPSPGFAESRSARRKAVQEVLAGPASTAATSDSAVDISTPAAIPFSFDSTTPPPPAAKPKPPQPAKPKSSSVARPRPEVASIEPPRKEPPAAPKPKADPHAGLTKKGEVLFSGTDIAPQTDSADTLKSLAGELNSALDSGAVRVELEAFAGTPGDKSSDTRRLSLRRALAIRQMLIDKGVPASRIDVKALGGIDDHGDAERVDVYLRGAS
jgi:outer membrane protein OmpA-like peptidoglycan-associated protein